MANDASEKNGGDRLPPTLSIYLDLVRFGAALIVVLSHAWPILFPRLPLPWPGHQAVVVFFVLSGFVIAYASNRRALTLREYAIHRVARIYSVVIPALMLSLLAWLCVGSHGLGDTGPAVIGWRNAASGIAHSLLPIGQLWTIDIDPPLNAPFWSLNFEVWYYVLFATWHFLSGPARYFATIAVAIVAGPKILLLMPIWLLGVLLYWRRPSLTENQAAAVLIATTVAALLFVNFDLSVAMRTCLSQQFPVFMEQLHGANQFLGDGILSLIVATNFAAAGFLGRYGWPLIRASNWIRAAAGCTFSAYLYHMPLLAIGVLTLGLPPFAVIAFLVVAIPTVAQFTEKKTPRARAAVSNIFDALENLLRFHQSLRPNRRP